MIKMTKMTKKINKKCNKEKNLFLLCKIKNNNKKNN